MRMRRRAFISLLAGAAIAPRAARAQSGAVRRVGVLMNGAATESRRQSNLSAFVQGLRALGWSEDRNLRLDVRWNAGDAGLARIYTAQLIGLMPDVIVAGSTVNLVTVQQATNITPIVFVGVADPVSQGFISNIRRPGGNVTGFSLFEFSLGGKWLNLLKEITPHLKRVAVMFNPGTAPYLKFFMPVFDAATPVLGMQVVRVPTQTESDINPTLTEFAREPHSGLMLLGDSFTRLHNKEIADLAGRYRLPSIAPIDLAGVGGLMDYGPSFDVTQHYAHAAAYVDRILKGEKPGDLPVQTPTRYKLIINARTAKMLGLEVPATLLALADEVIE
jgi:putative ABC transport system substrate-binding protein